MHIRCRTKPTAATADREDKEKRRRGRKQIDIENRQAKMLYRLPVVYASFFILCTTIPKMLFFGSVKESVQSRGSVAIATL